MKDLYSKVKDRPSLKEFPIQATIDKSTQVYDNLNALKAEVDDWKPIVDWSSFKARLEKAVAEYNEACADAQDTMGILMKVKLAKGADTQAMARKKRLAREEFVSLFSELDSVCPDCVSKVAGDLMFSRDGTERFDGTSCRYNLAILDADSQLDNSCWKQPTLTKFEDDVPLEKRTHWHTQCAQRLKTHLDAMTKKADEAVTGMVANQWPGAAGSVEASSPFVFNDTAETRKNLFDSPPDALRIPVVAQKCVHCCPSNRVLPYRMHSMYLHVLRGTTAIVVLDPSQVCDHPMIFPWLKGLGDKALQKNPSFVATTGDTIWIPLGHVPLVIGCPTAALSEKALTEYKEKKKQMQSSPIDSETVAFAMTLVYDKQHFKADSSVRACIAATYTAANNYIFRGIKEHDFFKEWLKTNGRCDRGGASGWASR